MMKNYGYNEWPKGSLGKTADGPLYPRVSKGFQVILSFIVNLSGNKMSRSYYTKRPGVAKCEMMFRSLEAIPGRVKTNRGCFGAFSSLLKTNPTRLKTNSARLKTNPAKLKTNPAELKTNPARLKTNPARLETNPANLETNPAR